MHSIMRPLETFTQRAHNGNTNTAQRMLLGSGSEAAPAACESFPGARCFGKKSSPKNQ